MSQESTISPRAAWRTSKTSVPRLSSRRSTCATLTGLRAACKGVEFVLHQGAVASVPRSVKDPLGSHDSNVNGTLNLLHCGARRRRSPHRLRRVVLRLRRPADAAQARGDAAQPALALRRAEAHLRVLHPVLLSTPMGSKASACATSTSLARTRPPTRRTPASSRSSSSR